jgi:hypothetical protein
VLNRFGLRTLSIYGQFRNKITFYPVIEEAYVNSKNWYRKETDMWAEFGKRALTVKIRQPSHEFTFGVGISF